MKTCHNQSPFLLLLPEEGESFSLPAISVLISKIVQKMMTKVLFLLVFAQLFAITTPDFADSLFKITVGAKY